MPSHRVFAFLLALRACESAEVTTAGANVPAINAHFDFATQGVNEVGGHSHNIGERARLLSAMVVKDLQAVHEFVTLAHQHLDAAEQAKKGSSKAFLAIADRRGVTRPTINVHIVEPARQPSAQTRSASAELAGLEDEEVASREHQAEMMASLWGQLQNSGA